LAIIIICINYLNILDNQDNFKRTYRDMSKFVIAQLYLKAAKIPYTTMWQHWLVNTKPKKAFRLILNAFKKFYRIKKKIIQWTD